MGGAVSDRIQQAKRRIRNLAARAISGNYRFSILSVLVLLPLTGAGLVLEVLGGLEPESLDAAVLVGAVLGAALIAAVIPRWAVLGAALLALWAGLVSFAETLPLAGGALGSLGLLLAPALQVARNWERAVVLRLGRFRNAAGPGVFLLLPFLDSVASFVDTRIRVTDFTAERSLTSDTVPVRVDALAFWMVWDAGKAVLEVEDYLQAVTLGAQTALRDAIGRSELATLLSERDRIGDQIQQVLDDRTNDWGITVLNVGFTEILVPPELEDVLSKRAQAERERQARVILGSAELEVAETFRKAAEQYRGNPEALQLRAMNMIYESTRVHGGMVLMPADALNSMNLGAVLGLQNTQRLDRITSAGTQSHGGGVNQTNEPDTGSGDTGAGPSGDPESGPAPNSGRKGGME